MLLYLHSDHGLRLYVHLPGIEPGPGISPEALPTRERQDATRSLHRRVIRNDHFYHSKSRFSEGPMEVWNVGCSLPPSIRLSACLPVSLSVSLSIACDALGLRTLPLFFSAFYRLSGLLFFSAFYRPSGILFFSAFYRPSGVYASRCIRVQHSMEE